MAYKVGLLDTDVAFQRALSEYVNLHTAIPIQLFLFSTMEAWQTFDAKDSLELLLVGDAFCELAVAEERMVLTNKRELTEREGYLFRYQNVKVLLELVLKIVESRQKKMVSEGMLLAVYSPLGRCGKTTLAKGLCRHLPASLYVDWEGIPEEMPENDAGSHFLYCLKSKNLDIAAYFQEDACAQITAPECFLDIRQMEGEDIVWLRAFMRQQNIQRNVVFDIGTTVLSGYSLLSAFDRVLVPVLADAGSQAKLEVFKQLYRKETENGFGLQYVSLEGSEVEAVIREIVR